MPDSILTVDENGIPNGVLDLEHINGTADTLARKIVTAACIDDDLAAAEAVILEHFDHEGNAHEAISMATIHLLAAALQELAATIREGNN